MMVTYNVIRFLLRISYLFTNTILDELAIFQVNRRPYLKTAPRFP